MVPYGFTRPIEWTSQPPCDPSQKWDALPVHVIEYLTLHDPNGRRIGTSLFIDGSVCRGVRKHRYMKALAADVVFSEYVPRMRRYVPPVEHELRHEYCLRVMVNLTLALHLGRDPTSAEHAAATRLCHGLTRSLQGLWHERDPVEDKRMLHAACIACKEDGGGMITHWRRAGMPLEDLYVEFAHNLFGMALNWSVLVLVAMERGVTLPMTDEAEAVRFASEARPAPVAASRVGGTMILHDLDTAFGTGARRCPGEWLTYVLLQHFRTPPTLPPPSPHGVQLGLYHAVCRG